MMSMVATDNETKRPRDEIGGQAVNCGMCGDFLSRYEFRWSAVKVSGWLCGRHKIRGILLFVNGHKRRVFHQRLLGIVLDDF